MSCSGAAPNWVWSTGEEQLAGWRAYLALLHKWNRAYNLTAIRNPADMVTRHLLDSLAIAPHLMGDRLVDVGTGPACRGCRWRSSIRSAHLICWIATARRLAFFFR